MLEIIVCGVTEVDEYIDEADAVISIMNPGYTIYAPQSIIQKETENRHSVLRLEFDDVWSENAAIGDEIVTIEIINEVLDFGLNFYEQYGDEGRLLIHCHEGISRSAGIAIALYTAINQDYQLAVDLVSENRPQAVPNIEIIRLTDEMFKLNEKLLDAAWEKFY